MQMMLALNNFSSICTYYCTAYSGACLNGRLYRKVISLFK